MTKKRHDINLQVETLVTAKKNNRALYTDAELQLLREFSGAGGKGKFGADGEGLLYEFFTPDYLADLMWELARKYGYNDKGKVLEPSCATGALIRPAKDYSLVTGFEINPVSASIAKVLYPGCTIHNGYFETAFLEFPRFTKEIKKGVTWLKDYPYSLVIGNPPYGIYRNQYSGYFNRKFFKQIEIFFIYKGLELLEPGGLLIYLQSSNFMRTGDKYNDAKEKIGLIATLEDAYRLPKVFESSKVPTDIMVLRKK
jgi:hypothetical protein